MASFVGLLEGKIDTPEIELNYAKFNHSAESSNYFDNCIHHLLIYFTLTMRVRHFKPL